MLATLVPPFAPVDAVGAPPERASLPVEETNLPMIMIRREGKGHILFLPFALATLADAFGLRCHRDLVEHLIGLLRPNPVIWTDLPEDVIVNVFRNGKTLLIQLVNEVGQRPIADTIPLYHYELRIPVGLHRICSVRSVIEECPVSQRRDDDILVLRPERFNVWDVIAVDIA